MSRPHPSAAALIGALLWMLALAAGSGRVTPPFGQLEPGDDAEFPRVRYSDSLLSANTRCVMSHNRLSVKVRPIHVNGTAVGFCCAFCGRDLAASPEGPLREAGLVLTCPVKAGAPAPIDSTTRTWVNFELYYFSSSAARARFLERPERYVGMVTDPVSLSRFGPSRRSPRTEAKGRWWFFASDSTRAVFLADQDHRSQYPTH